MARTGFRVTNGADMRVRISLTREKILTACQGALKESANLVRDTARDYAPVDYGNLEAAIKVLERKRYSGPYSRLTSITVGVDEDMQVGRGNTRDVVVGQYAQAMHDGIYNLGARSLAKAAERGVNVGPGYITRALRDNEPEIERIMNDAVKVALATLALRSRR